MAFIYSVTIELEGNATTHKVTAGGFAEASEVILKRFSEAKILSVVCIEGA